MYRQNSPQLGNFNVDYINVNLTNFQALYNIIVSAAAKLLDSYARMFLALTA